MADRSGPMVAAGLDAEHIEQYRSDVQAAYVCQWAPALERVGATFRTYTVDMAPPEAHALVAAHNAWLALQNKATSDGRCVSPEEFDAFFDELIQQQPVLARACDELQVAMQACRRDWKCSKVFVKGSSRSAKDAVIHTPQMRADFFDRCKRMRADPSACQGGWWGRCHGCHSGHCVLKSTNEDAPKNCSMTNSKNSSRGNAPENTPLDSSQNQPTNEARNAAVNDALIMLLGAGKDAMSSHDAVYFMKLFVRSERIHQDLTLAIERQPFQHGWAIREWVDIDIGMEFRGFVHKGCLTALCQYDYLICAPALQDGQTRADIVAAIQLFFQNLVAPALCTRSGHAGPEWSAVVDFAVDCAGRVWVVELNPFQPSTDGAMFSWEREGEVLRGGPFEFRWQDRAQNASVALSVQWRALLHEVVK